jgi:hypothetical protein
MESVFLPLRLRLREPTAPLDMALNARLVGNATASYVRFGRDVELVTAEADNYHVNIRSPAAPSPGPADWSGCRPPRSARPCSCPGCRPTWMAR